ncbi:hypothetical protein ACFX15_020964 [Malus domestica]
MESRTPSHLPPTYPLTLWGFSFLMGRRRPERNQSQSELRLSLRRLIRLGGCLSPMLAAMGVVYGEARESGLEKAWDWIFLGFGVLPTNEMLQREERRR